MIKPITGVVRQWSVCACVFVVRRRGDDVISGVMRKNVVLKGGCKRRKGWLLRED